MSFAQGDILMCVEDSQSKVYGWLKVGTIVVVESAYTSATDIACVLVKNPDNHKEQAYCVQTRFKRLEKELIPSYSHEPEAQTDYSSNKRWGIF